MAMGFLILLLISRLIFCDAANLHTANNFSVKDSNIKKHHILDDKIPERNVSNITNYRLSNDIIPDHYFINLSLTNVSDYKIISISGMISIDFRIIHPTKTIDFHAQKPYIKIRKYIFLQQHNSRNKYVTTDLVEKSYNPLSHIFVLYFAEELSQGRYTLKMEFDCNVDDEMESFFQTTYINETEKKWMAATRFHKIGARQIFPCWDEPELTATFRIAIKHRLKHMVLSNMPVNKTDIINAKRMWSIFKVTPIISTHLVAFIVFDPIPTHPKQEIWSPFCLEFAQNIAIAIINELYFTWNVSEALEQMQHVAIPNFPDNAMVNWGLNFYRLSDIIYEEEKDPVIRKIEVARLIACKIMQQWMGLGNLVSPTSGSSLWLNDGIPMLLGIQVLDKIFPNWQVMDLFTVQYRYESLHLDCGFLKPLTSKVTDISDVNSFFSYPYYSKAFTIMNMLRNILSDFTFDDGIKIYFNTYKYKAASINDFWSTMQIVENISSNSSNITLNVSRIMNTWTTQSQYPVLKIKQYDKATQFIILLENCNVFHLNEWWIPVVLSTAEDIWDPTMFYNYIWLTSNKSMKILQQVRFKEEEIMEILLNLSLIGYFRVNYDVPIWNRIIHFLVSKNVRYPFRQIRLPALIKANLIDDAFHFVITDQLKSEIFWKMSKFLKTEVEYIAWYPMFKAFEYISRILPIQSNKVDKIKENVQILFLVITTMDIHLKENSEDDDLTKCLKQEIAKWACVFDYDECISTAKNNLTMHINSFSTNRILPWWKTWTFCHGMGNSYDMWSNVLHLWLESSDTKTSSRMLEFLCCTKNEAAIKLMLRKGDDPNLSERPFSNLQIRDHIKMFSLLITKHAHKYVVLDYILSNFEKLKPREISTVAALINIINHVYINIQFRQIENFVFKNLKELYPKVQQKIIIRKNQITSLHNDLDRLW